MAEKHALITGVSSGLGRALAKCFTAHGFTVTGVCRTDPAPLEIAHWIPADLTTPEGRGKICTEMKKICAGRLDVLLNNAGCGIYAAWEEMKEEDLRTVLELDFFAPVLLTKSLLPLLKNTHGSLINISSAAARLWLPCMGGYCAAKAALSMFSNSLRPEVEKYGIRVLDVAPGQINTGFSSRSFGTRRPPDSPGSKHHSPEALAETLYAAWKKRLRRITYPRILSPALFLLHTMLPRLYDRISIKLWRLDRTGGKPEE